MIQVLSFIFGAFFVIVCPSVIWGFDNNDVHRKINKNAGEQSRLGEYLKSELYTSEGLDTKFGDKKVIQLLEVGGQVEDATPRPLNHFHDPLQPWESAGITGGSSALLWAQHESNEASWNKARQSYYQALITGAPEAYAATFTYLGQLMHLVSDMAVPAHVRNDLHPEVLLPKNIPITHFEVYTEINHDTLNYTGANPGPGLFSLAKNPEAAPTPISALFDIDVYDGFNPEVTRGAAIGLAEYTNANFLSERTVFNGNYPYPALAETTYDDVHIEPKVVFAEDSKEDKVKYVTRKDDPDFKIAAVSYWANASYEAEPVIYGDTLVLDDQVFEDYANKLVPKTVGYSSALLDYFC
jgi:hypothetical protein